MIEQGIPGDHNNDGKVDAADYVFWRKTNINGAQGYADFVKNFGEMQAGAGGGGSVPEPGSVALVLLGLFSAVAYCRSRG